MSSSSLGEKKTHAKPQKNKIKRAEIITRAVQFYSTNLSLPFATFWLAITPKTNAKHPSFVVPSVLWQIGRPGLLIGMEGIADLLGQGWRNGWGRQWARQGAAERSPPSPSSIHNGPRMPHASAVRCAVPCRPPGAAHEFPGQCRASTSHWHCLAFPNLEHLQHYKDSTALLWGSLSPLKMKLLVVTMAINQTKCLSGILFISAVSLQLKMHYRKGILCLYFWHVKHKWIFQYKYYHL